MNTLHSAGQDELRVGAILAEALPVELLTAEAPDRYTVLAVFNRRPSRAEIDEIQGNTTRMSLTEAGHPTVELRVSDRRLEISNTNLEELAGGLATVIAQRLHVISVASAAVRKREESEMRKKTHRETDRAALIALAAAAVTFAPPSSSDGAHRFVPPAAGAPDPTWFDVRNDFPADP
ncbi:MAG: hypothetical protein J0I18_10165 [Actinobacteria bacterium]|nr:hypothetical protein [Actinomycetota bacterium]